VKPLGNYKNSAVKITFAEEAQFMFGSNPEPSKYDAMEMDKIKTKPRYTKINENLVRFKKAEKDDKPSPLSYNVADAISKSQWSNSKNKGPGAKMFGGTERRSVFAAPKNFYPNGVEKKLPKPGSG
jgi:hypothetical protein